MASFTRRPPHHAPLTTRASFTTRLAQEGGGAGGQGRAGGKRHQHPRAGRVPEHQGCCTGQVVPPRPGQQRGSRAGHKHNAREVDHVGGERARSWPLLPGWVKAGPGRHASLLARADPAPVPSQTARHTHSGHGTAGLVSGACIRVHGSGARIFVSAAPDPRAPLGSLVGRHPRAPECNPPTARSLHGSTHPDSKTVGAIDAHHGVVVGIPRIPDRRSWRRRTLMSN